MSKLTVEDKETLMPIIGDTSVWGPFMKVLVKLEQSYIQRLVEYDLNKGPQGLVIAKAQVEGIKDYLYNLDRVRDDLISPGGKNGKKRGTRRSHED